MGREGGSTGGCGDVEVRRDDLKEIGSEKMLSGKRSLHGPGSGLSSGHMEPLFKMDCSFRVKIEVWKEDPKFQ